MDPEAIALYFEYLAIPAPFTIYKGIFKLPAAHYMIVDINGNMDIGEYWHLKDSVINSNKIKSERDAVAFIKEELKRAVSMEMVSDVPVGLFLSGGIDSSLIAAIVRKELKKDLRTFSVGFSGSHGPYDETAKARSVAEYFGTEHYSENMDVNAIEILPDILKHFGEPFGNLTAIAMYRISQFAKKHVKVCLAGVGGDELFAGYPRYAGFMFHSKYKFIGNMLNHALIKKIIASKKTIPSAYSFTNRLRRYAVSVSDDNFSTYDRIRSLLSNRPGILRTQSGSKRIENIMRTSGISDILDNMLFTDIKSYLPDDLLTYCDRMSMANSLEVRVPLCNFKLVEASFKIDSSCKMRNWNMKFVLKEILRQYLPDGVANKKKQGFSVPAGYWLTNELREYGRKWIEDTNPDIFDMQSVVKLWDEHQSLQYDHGSLLWAIVVFNLWRRGAA
jgi:asparagine synthase (glutamine-hydrolysing)